MAMPTIATSPTSRTPAATSMAALASAPVTTVPFLAGNGLGMILIKLGGFHCFVSDHINCSSHAKLYVAQVPSTASEEDIRPVFKLYGDIIEVVMLKDKRTGLQQGKCFVKYTTALEAGNAIAALNNLYTFPGEAVPITVRYADGEKERLGVGDKVFVAMINKEASEKEIEKIFSPYGVVKDVFIVRDKMKQSRGCGFVKFAQAEMARAAIKGLHGNFIMRGCDLPLVVRFADPKKHKS